MEVEGEVIQKCKNRRRGREERMQKKQARIYIKKNQRKQELGTERKEGIVNKKMHKEKKKRESKEKKILKKGEERTQIK